MKLLRLFWLKFTNAILIFQLRSLPDELDSCSLRLTERYDNVLLKLIVAGDCQTPTVQETTLPERPYYVKDFMNVFLHEIYPERYSVEFGFLDLTNRQEFMGKDDIR